VPRKLLRHQERRVADYTTESPKAYRAVRARSASTRKILSLAPAPRRC